MIISNRFGLEELAVGLFIYEGFVKRFLIKIIFYCVIFKYFISCRFQIVSQWLKRGLQIIPITYFNLILFIQNIMLFEYMTQILVIVIQVIIRMLSSEYEIDVLLHQFFYSFLVTFWQHREPLLVVYKHTHI